jgi:hypothetical protein
MKTELCNLMDKFGSDKASYHNYTLFYYDLLKEKKYQEVKIFEVGLGTNNTSIPSNMGANGRPGASLRAWKEFFPNAKIYGADIDKNILFHEERIKTFFCDQTDEVSIKKMWENDELKNESFDLIIDDGLHEINANINFLKNSFKKLKNDSAFIIEDIIADKIDRYKEKIQNLSKTMNFEFEIKNFDHTNKYDNCICFIKKLK